MLVKLVSIYFILLQSRESAHDVLKSFLTVYISDSDNKAILALSVRRLVAQTFAFL